MRKGALAGFAFLAVFAFFVGVFHVSLIQNTNFLSAVISRTLVDLANADRSQSKIGTLRINPTLEQVAQMKANDMATKGYFAHTSPEGLNPWHWFKQAGYDFVYAGENLAVNFSDSAEVDKAWMNSPGHRDNILNTKYTEVGIATANGVYQGRPTTFVVQVFGRPMTEEQKRVLVKVDQALAQKAPAVPTDVASKSTVKPALKPKVTQVPPKATTSPSGSPAKIFDNKNLGGQATTSTTTLPVLEPHRVLGTETFAEIENIPVVENMDSNPSVPAQHSYFDTLLTNPKKNLSAFYLFFAGFLFACLILMIFIEIRKQHPALVILGFVLIFAILTLLYIFRTSIFPEVLVL